jgi:hypothetical protein
MFIFLLFIIKCKEKSDENKQERLMGHWGLHILLVEHDKMFSAH